MRTLSIRDPDGGWRDIQIDDSYHFEAGREGQIYVTADGQWALKLFVEASPRILALKSRKVAAMLDDRFVSYFLKKRQNPDFAWPAFSVHAGQREESFVGYGMRYLKDYHSLDSLLAPTDGRYANFSELSRVLLCSYLAYLFALCHARDVVVGDVKANNIFVRGDGNHLGLIDCDSFQFSFNGVEYTTDVATHDFASPRLIQISKTRPHGTSLENVHREFSDDTFALAVMCFRLLMNGFHPFHAAQGKIFDNIQSRVFAYGGGDIRPPWGAPIDKYDQLPFNLKSMFESAFRKAEYISAVRWQNALYEYAGSLEKARPVPAAPISTSVDAPEKVAVSPLGAPLPRPIPKPGFWARLWNWLTRRW